MATSGLYRRVLPSPPAIDFASDEGKKLFIEAIQAGTMEGFYKLISYFQTQSELTYCGLASLSMVLNALAIDPGRKWKGPWRWYDESMLGCPKELKKIKAEGISFGNAVHWAQRAGAEVEAFQTSQTNVDFFRQSVKKCCSSDNCHLVSSYHRAGLEQTGAGHFSPIGGYHAGSDMVLILDVARFKYRPHWVPLTLLWEAMDTVNKTTGQRRGFMLISKPKRDAGLLYTLVWVSIGNFSLFTLRTTQFLSVAEVKREQECGIGISEEEKQRLASREELLKHVRDTGFFKYIVNFLSSTSCCSRVPVFGGSENLDEIPARVCCHVAEILSGKSSTSGCSCCHETCVKCMKADGHKTATVLSATKNEGKVNMLVPQSLMKLCSGAPDPNDCTSTRPVGSNILTVLLLMLPPETWCGIKDEILREEVQSLVSMDSLPAMLQREALPSLFRNLYDMKKRSREHGKEVLEDMQESSRSH
ncbi:hypothetical protein EUGRSUZ_L01652 [Eucalyptus grandis]|uniref:glutathione gamma-glutamylcysteinyltransferase n=3 Tax=Eucalyptus grandis TaxID=71139 RepID=A0AAD9TAB2_EUCGR|nr:hypothetical protein EUGRSUZ_L01652 [Eucalyptus grandis]